LIHSIWPWMLTAENWMILEYRGKRERLGRAQFLS
jgi:hypothetical protein